MGSRYQPYRSWRQKGLAAITAGMLALPFVDGCVKEHMPGGVLAHLRERHAAEQPHDTRSLVPSLFGGAEPVSEERPTLESILARSNRSSDDLPPKLAFKTATSLAHLTSTDIQGYERAAQLMGISPIMLATISVIESEGGQIPTPRMFSPDDPKAPQGHHHVKPDSLACVIEQASEARTYFEERLGDRWTAISQKGWAAISHYETLLSEQEREVFEEAHGSSGARRMFALASIIPEDIEDLDLADAQESAIAAGVMLAYGASYLSSHGFTVDPESLLLVYTAGQRHARNALSNTSDTPLIDNVRDSIGPYSAWHIEAGSQLLDHLSNYGSLHDAHEHALRIVDLTARAPEANEETIGLLYAMSQKNPELYEQVVAALTPDERGRRADLNKVTMAYADR